MKSRSWLSVVTVVTVAAGSALWWATRPPPMPPVPQPGIAPGALWAATFSDTAGRTHSLAEFQGKVAVVNFWATWCAPCREEMPAFVRLQERWTGRGVQFVGLANDDPRKVDRFASELRINYPLWVGGDSVGDLSKRLGNRLGVLPHTAIIDRRGQVIDSKVGPYTETELDGKLRQLAGSSG